MKHTIFIIAFIACISKLFAQCPDPGTIVPVQRIMNVTTAEDYTKAKCDVIIEAGFVSSTISNFKHPGKFKQSVVFQVAPRGEEDNYKDARGQRGLMVAIPKEDANRMFEFKKGDKLKIRGNTYTIYGFVYFIASSYELED